MKNKIDIIVDNKIRIKVNAFTKDELKELKKKFTYSNPQYYKAQNRGYKPNCEQYVMSYSTTKTEISLSRGTLFKVKQFLNDKGYTFHIIDKRLKMPYDGIFANRINPFEYQVNPIERGKKFQNCIIQGECGCGKTEMALKIACELNQWTLIIVPTLELMTQWIERIKSKVVDGDKLVGQWGGGKKELKPITVAIVNSANNDSDYLADKFGTIIVDEAHRSPSSIFSNVIDKSKAFYRFAFTATPYRKDGLQFLMHDMFGKIVAKVTEDDLKNAGRRVPVDVMIVLTNFEYQEYNDGEATYNDLLQKMINDRDRNNLIFMHLKENLESYNLLLTDRVEFAKHWYSVLNKRNIETGLMLGGQQNKEESARTKKTVDCGELHVAIGTTVADEGLDIPRLQYIYCTTPTANNKRRLRQQRGRAGRPSEGKDKSTLYYFCDIKINGAHMQVKNIVNYLPESKVYVKHIDGTIQDAKAYLKECI